MSQNKHHEQDEDRSVIRQQNRAMRSINRSLRAQVRRLQEQADNVFQAICETETEAERAFSALWRTGYFNCDPKDYDYMVEKATAAFDHIRDQELKGKPKRVVQELTGKPKRKFSDS
jgi:hypothetical protein